MDFKDLKNKTWIDWVKVIVAIDIAFVGFGLIIDQDINFLSHIFGFISRIPMGIMYVFISVLILKRVFPRSLHVGPVDAAKVSPMENDLNDGLREGKNILSGLLKSLNRKIHQLIDWVDSLLDRIAHFFEKRHHEVKKEVSTLIGKEDQKK